MRHLALSLAASLAFAAACLPSLAQDGAAPADKAPEQAPAAKAPSPEEQRGHLKQISSLMTAAYDHMEAGAKLLEAQPKAAAARYAKAVESYSAVLPLLDKVPSAPKARIALVRQIAHYNTACANARQGKADAALKALSAALASGYGDLARLEQDPDLSSIRTNPRFVNLLEREQARLAEKAVAAAKAELSKDALFPYELSAKTIDGKPVELSKLKGKVVIVDYWGTWCPPCRMEVPHFVELIKEFKGDLVVIGMTWERGQAGPQVIEGVRAFAKEKGVNYPLVLLTKQEDLAKVPDLEAFPTTLFLDRQGRVRAREVGYRDLAALRKLVKALAAEPAPAKAGEPKTPEKPGSKPAPF